MRHAHALSDLGSPQRSAAYANAIEWEDLPSFASALNERLYSVGEHQATATLAAAPVWTETVPACLDPLTVSGPFQETVAGLATREVLEPDVFRHFFGASGKG